MPAKRRSAPKQPTGRSVKAHVSPPPKVLRPRVHETEGRRHDVGQFTGEGTPPIEKK